MRPSSSSTVVADHITQMAMSAGWLSITFQSVTLRWPLKVWGCSTVSVDTLAGRTVASLSTVT